ncbi:MAG: TRAP transporter large permease subunit [Clostridiales bacterium]|nr:TRAP transporter large permease subunit [Clostridiales bacterium]
MDWTFILAVSLFAITYICLLVFPKIRAYIALGSAALFVILGILPVTKVLGAVDWNVLMMIGGTMGIVALFIDSKMPALMADMIIKKTPNLRWAIIALSLFSSIVSAFIDNVATVLMLAPIALSICQKLNVSPVKSLIAISIASNLQGAATLVGDTTSIMMAGAAGMNFMDFFVYKGNLGMFFVVQAGCLAATFVLWLLLREEKQPIKLEGETKVTNYFPTVLLFSMIALLIAASFIPEKYKLDITNGLICMSLLVVGLVVEFARKKNFAVIKDTIKEIDYFTLLLLTGLFIVIGGIKEAGVIDALSKLFVKAGGGNLFLIFTIIVWASVLISMFVDNIPYTATMLPVVASIAALMNIDPTILYFGLLCGATLGGNLTPIGASANIAALGILRKQGHEVKALEFMKISVPYTLAAVTTGYLLIWFIWA